MHESNWEALPFKPDYQVLISLIKSSCSPPSMIKLGRALHSYVIRSGHFYCQFMSKLLLNMYSKQGVLDDCLKCFCQTDRYHDPVPWNILLSGLARSMNHDNEVMNLFNKMHVGGEPKPDPITLAVVLPVCARLGDLHAGQRVHSFAIKFGIESETLIGNALLSMYARCGSVCTDGYNSFNGISHKDVISWNALISGFADNFFVGRAFESFRQMVKGQIRPNCATFVTLLPVCALLERNIAHHFGKEIHCYILKQFQSTLDVSVLNAIVSLYSRIGRMEEAEFMFQRMQLTDVVSWNTLISGYASNYKWGRALELFREFSSVGVVEPDCITLGSILSCCAHLRNLGTGKSVHGYITRRHHLSVTTALGNALVSFYAKCDKVDSAFRTFLLISRRDLISWNLMVQVYAENDYPVRALFFIRDLQSRGMKPDAMTIMGVLPVCAQTASAHLLRQCHGYVLRFRLEDVRLTGAILDIYSKCGSMDSARKLFESSTCKDLVMFASMVGGYAMHGMGEEALGVYSCMIESGIKPDHVILTSTLSACSRCGLVDEGLRLFDSIRKVHGLEPTMEQYACVVDLFARGGRIKDAYSFATGIPVEAGANVWATLLGACRTHHEVEVGRMVAGRLFEVEAESVGNYVLMSNLYAADARWDGVLEMRRMMRMRDVKKPVGCSWIEVERTRSAFVAGDCFHPQRCLIYHTLSILDHQIKESLDF